MIRNWLFGWRRKKKRRVPSTMEDEFWGKPRRKR